MSSQIVRRTLLDLIQARCGSEAEAWLKTSVNSPTDQMDQIFFELAKQVGRKALIASFKDRGSAVLMTALGAMPIGHWRSDRAARAWLLAERAALSETPFDALYAAYDNGDTETRIAALYAINLVDDENVDRGLAIIHDAGRTYLESLMAAGWCHHPFATKHMNDVEYRKAVLKALFCDVPIEGFLGLSERADNALALSLKDFADEREAAGRAVPDVLWPVLALHPQPGLIARLIGRLEHPLSAQRQVAAVSLRNAKDKRALPFLKERLERETDPKVLAGLNQAIAATESA